MDIKEVKDLIQEILQSDILEFELEHTGTKVRLRRGSHHEPVHPAADLSTPPAPAHPKPLPRPAIKAPESLEGEEDEAGLHLITSPIVGTFYRTATPGAEPFVRVGDAIEEGKTLCIVEAMKLLNEIPSDIAGSLVRIYVENGHPVEFGQTLFAIRPAR